MLLRWLLGLFKRLLNIWDDKEWDYYTHTGLDPKPPAFSRWKLEMHSMDRPSETGEDELLPRKTYTLVLHDKTGLSVDDVVYFNSDLGRVEVLQKKFAEELQSRNCGWFWHDQIKLRNLDFIHNLRIGEDLHEGDAAEEELERTRREFFRG